MQIQLLKYSKKFRLLTIGLCKPLLLYFILTISVNSLHAQTNTFPPTGNAGIGVTNPNFGLTINASQNQTVLGGNTSSAIRIINSYGAAFGRRSELQFGLSQNSNESLAVIAAEYTSWDNSNVAGDLVFGTSPNTSPLMFERMRINRDGNIGIGTNSPDAKLHIAGSNGNSTNLILSANYVNTYRWRLKTIDRGNAIDMDFTASDGYDTEETILKLTRSTSGRPEFQLHNNTIVANDGNVGIGTATPTSKLSVKGTIHAHEVKVDLNVQGPDYVFETEYNLLSLHEVENYITQNKHLPEVPSAKEMEQNGINLSEMNMLLLKKVEELTLYVIEQEKRLKELEAKNK